jgi:hypothetical protein
MGHGFGFAAQQNRSPGKTGGSENFGDDVIKTLVHIAGPALLGIVRRTIPVGG